MSRRRWEESPETKTNYDIYVSEPIIMSLSFLSMIFHFHIDRAVAFFTSTSFRANILFLLSSSELAHSTIMIEKDVKYRIIIDMISSSLLLPFAECPSHSSEHNSVPFTANSKHDNLQQNKIMRQWQRLFGRIHVRQKLAKIL